MKRRNIIIGLGMTPLVSMMPRIAQSTQVEEKAEGKNNEN